METYDATKTSKRKFVKVWLDNERYKSWIREVPWDNTMYYCAIYNASFSCSALHVSRHTDFRCHKSNITENVMDINTEQKRGRVQKSRYEWLDNEEFQP